MIFEQLRLAELFVRVQCAFLAQLLVRDAQVKITERLAQDEVEDVQRWEDDASKTTYLGRLINKTAHLARVLHALRVHRQRVRLDDLSRLNTVIPAI